MGLRTFYMYSRKLVSYLSFSRQLKDEFKGLGNKASRAITQSAKGAWKTAVRATDPHVETGALRYNWKLSVNRRSSYVPARVKRPRPSRAPNINFRIRYDKRIYLYNNMPYASYVNNGEGPGIRRPARMLEKATMFFKSDLQTRLNRIRS